MICYYHAADFDGICSAAIVNFYEPDVKLIPVNYGDNIDLNIIEEGERVYVVDFSFPIEQMIELNNKAALIWIDHHKTAIEAAYDAGFLASCSQMLEVGKAGCELTAQWFMGTDFPLPRSIFLLSRYDVWDWPNVKDSIEFQYGMRTFSNTEYDPKDRAFWGRIFMDTDFVNAIIEKGRIIYEYEQTQNAKYIRSCMQETELCGYKAISVNKGLCNSTIFDSVADASKYDLYIAYVVRKGLFNVSLYSTKIDVSAIAKLYGGGGHAGAAGFSCIELPFSVLSGSSEPVSL